MNRTMLSNRIGTRRIRRLTMMALTGSVLALAAAAPVSAQSFGDGYVSAAVDCNLATKTANVSVFVMEPKKYALSGLVFYVQVFAKAHSAARYDFIGEGQTPVIRTGSLNVDPFIGNYTTYSRATIFNTAFTGRIETTYDVSVNYWWRVPTSSTWAGPYGFTVPGDPQSTITLTTNHGYGNLTRPAGDCHL